MRSGRFSEETWQGPEHEPYGFTERELAFKLIASHAMVDPDYFEYLRTDPEAAVAHLYISLREEDMTYLRENVDWETLAEVYGRVNTALRLDIVTNSW